MGAEEANYLPDQSGRLAERYKTILGVGDTVCNSALRRPPINNLVGIPRIGERYTDSATGTYGQYQVTQGYIELRDGDVDDEWDASLATKGFEAYTKDEGSPEGRGVVVFAAGGPLFGLAPMQYGVVGPKGPVVYGQYGDLRDVCVISENRECILPYADLVFAESIGVGYQDGPMLSATAPGVDPRFFWSTDRHVQAHRATVEGYLEAFPLYNKALILAGTSFGGGFTSPGAALDLAKRGIFVDGIALFSAHYDYALQDYQSGDPTPFVTYAPVMAMTHGYHARKNVGDTVEDQRFFRHVSAWGASTYRRALEQPGNGRLRDQVIRQLAAWTGLSLCYIADDLQIDPVKYSAERMKDEGLSLSLVDGRVTYPSSMRVDSPSYPMQLERWIQREFPAFNAPVAPYDANGIIRQWLKEEYGLQRGFPKYFRYDYEVDPPRIDPALDGNLELSRRAGAPGFYKSYVNAYPDWEAGGIWSRNRAHEAMVELLTIHPGIRLMHLAGMYDPLNPPERALIFWREVQQLCPELIILECTILDPLPELPREPCVVIITVPEAHIMGRSDRLARYLTNRYLGSFVRSIVAEKMARAKNN